MELKTVSTNDLLDELVSRHNAVLFIGVQYVNSKESDYFQEIKATDYGEAEKLHNLIKHEIEGRFCEDEEEVDE